MSEIEIDYDELHVSEPYVSDLYDEKKTSDAEFQATWTRSIRRRSPNQRLSLSQHPSPCSRRLLLDPSRPRPLTQAGSPPVRGVVEAADGDPGVTRGGTRRGSRPSLPRRAFAEDRHLRVLERRRPRSGPRAGGDRSRAGGGTTRLAQRPQERHGPPEQGAARGSGGGGTGDGHR